MPTSLVLRDGKSDWDAAYGVDAERSLAKRGPRAAGAIGRHLGDAGPEPALALTSPSTRACDPCERVWTSPASTAGAPRPLVLRPRAPGGSRRAEQLDESLEEVLVVGHEPTWSDLIAHLSGSSGRFPTAALASARPANLVGGHPA